ncbi:hypothetical protein LPJ66_000718 [Kickxella alabastrina]|uniref:Uncharacterized protein n=1 Tax=Kickxella alabastrina TaxID=61397 RepID=A0ACC1IVD5_9FUNG|nr:hypothetical protein LPJ66_000718 [Kickxella alabastrina]
MNSNNQNQNQNVPYTGDSLFDSFVGADYYSPTLQLQMESLSRQPSSPVVLASSRSMPNTTDARRSLDIWSTPLPVDTQDLSSFGLYRGPATAPIPSSTYTEPPVSGTLAAFDSLLASAYESYLNTPVNPANVPSPQFGLGASYSTLYGSGPLFAPLDEIKAKDTQMTADNILEQMAYNDPTFRQNLVHALVDFIKPVVAYHPVEQPTASSSASSIDLLAMSLFTQAQNLTDAAPHLSEWSDQSNAALFSESPNGFSDNSISGDAPRMDSLLGLLSPPIIDAFTPLISPLAVNLAASTTTTAVETPLFVMAPEDVFRTSYLPTATTTFQAPAAQPIVQPAAQSSKRQREEEDDGEEDSVKRFHCEICNRGFSRLYNMRTHQQTHEPRSEKARPFNCAHCQRTFTRKHDMIRHQVLHDDSDGFKCKDCNRGFARMDVLERHSRAVHKH